MGDALDRRCERPSAIPDDAPTEMTPADVIRWVLQAPVDLLWNGGIGTYVKATNEGHTEVGDRANDPVRINGNQVRARVVGEGGNLGFTQRGRIEYALSGGRINTDFIDNSAGVDTSDREVNLKILLGLAIETRRAHDGRTQRPAAGVHATTSFVACSTTTTSRRRSSPRRSPSRPSGTRRARI